MSETKRRPGGHPGMRGRGVPGEKAKDFRGSLGKLIRHCKPFYPVICIAILGDLAGVIIRLIGPNKISEITNLITAGLRGEIDMPAIQKICITLIILYVVGALLSFMTGLVMTVVTQKVNRGLRDGISHKINRLPVSYFQSTSTGDVLSRVTNDVDTIGQTLQNSLTSLVSAVTMFIGSVVMMLSTNWVMALTAIVSSMLGFGLMQGIMSRSQKYFVARQRWLGDLNGHIEEIYTGHNVVRLFGAEQREQQAFDRINGKMQETDWKSQFMSGLMMPLMGFIGNFAYVAVCVVGAVLAMNGTITFGVIVAFMMYVRLFTSPLSQLAQAATNLQSAAAAAERVFEFLEAKEMPDESHLPAQTKTVRGEVAFDHVRFGYTPDKIIITTSPSMCSRVRRSPSSVRLARAKPRWSIC